MTRLFSGIEWTAPAIFGLAVVATGLSGCNDSKSSKHETKITTPGGTVTITTEKQTEEKQP